MHPDVPVIIISAIGQVKDAVKTMKFGALEYITKRFELHELLALVKSVARMGQALQESRQLREAVSRPAPNSELSGISARAKEFLETLAKISPLDSTVLITRESGVGKGRVARMIHCASKRAGEPFITTSCPALPRELLEDVPTRIITTVDGQCSLHLTDYSYRAKLWHQSCSALTPLKRGIPTEGFPFKVLTGSRTREDDEHC